MAKASVLEIEIDSPKNANHFFRPLSQKIRGRFDVQRLMKHDDGAAKLQRQWPDPIPGQRLSLDLEAGTAAIVEPLHDPEFASIRQKIEKSGHSLPPARHDCGVVDVCTWAYWLKSAVEAGLARVVRGELLTDTEIAKLGKPQKNFIVQRDEDPIDKLSTGFDRMASALEKQNELLMKLLTSKG